MRKQRYIAFIAVIVGAASTALAQNVKPAATLKSFYAYDRTHSQAFSLATINARKKWFSSKLYQLFLNEIKREKEYLKINPTDKPHFGDGLPFRPSDDEPCELSGKIFTRTMSYGTVTVKGDAANVDVKFKYPKACGFPDLLYAVNMEKEKGRWVISDIRYFPGDTSLVEDLNRKEY